MKTKSMLQWAALVGAVIVTSTSTPAKAQGAGRGGPPSRARFAMVAERVSERLATAYGKVSRFDVNQDGQLDDSEKAALATAIRDGVVRRFPEAQLPDGTQPDPEKVLARIGAMYAEVALYDVNQDGKLDDDEQASVRDAITSGKLKRPEVGEGARAPRPGRRGGLTPGR